MSAIFLPEDVRELLKGKTVIYIGDSVQRSMYKDLVLLFQEKRYLTDQELRAKGELCFLGDELMEGGKKGEMTNSTKYREVRKFLYDTQTKVLYFFITACFGEYIEMLLKKLMKPDIIFMNSCLWDVHRYGTKGYEGYGPNLRKLVKLMKELHPSVLFAWTTTPPVDIRSKAGFLENRKDLVKINEVLRCNDIARQIMKKESVPIADFADVFRYFTHHRANDGVHWNEKAHRRMTNILLETVARHFNKPIPRPVSDEFSRNRDFHDRPPFPHSFSHPAFHHNNSWKSFDEDRCHYDPFMNDSMQDDFILGLDRSYGYGNYSYHEMEDEMASPRPMPPPHGRRMLMEGRQPPHMRPPHPPGYRFGSSDMAVMWDGRKRKVREDDVTDGYNKKQRLDDSRRFTGHERKAFSPMVESKAKLDQAQNASPVDLDEKPAASTEVLVPEEKAAVVTAVQTECRSKQKEDLPKLLPDEEQKPERSGPADEEKSPMLLESPASERAEDKDNAIPCGEKCPVIAHISESSDKESAVDAKESEEDPLLNESSVFGKLSSTTTMILQSIQNSAKPVGQITQSLGKSCDDRTLEGLLDEKAPHDGEAMTAITSLSTTAALEEEPEYEGDADPDKDGKTKTTMISYYDIEETFQDLEASLDKMDEGDGYMDSIDLDEESLLMDDTEDPTNASLRTADSKRNVNVALETTAEQENLSEVNVNQTRSDGQKRAVVIEGKTAAEKAAIGKAESLNKKVAKTPEISIENRGKTIIVSNVKKSETEVKDEASAKLSTEGIELSARSISDISVEMLAAKSNEAKRLVNPRPLLSEDSKNVVDAGKQSLRPEGITSLCKASNPSIKRTLTTASGARTDGSQANLKGTVATPVAKIAFVSSGASTVVPLDKKAAAVTPIPSSTPIGMKASVAKSAPVSVSAVSTGAKAIFSSFGTRTNPTPIASAGAKAASVARTTIAATTRSGVFPVGVQTFVSLDAKTNPYACIGSNATIVSSGPISNPVPTAAKKANVGAKIVTAPTGSRSTATSIGGRSAQTTIGTKMATASLGPKSVTPMLGKRAGRHKVSPNAVSAIKTPVLLSPENKTGTTRYSGLPDEKSNLPCFPNRPSLDMKSPFFKPKTATKIVSDTSGPPSKDPVSSARVSESQTSTETGAGVNLTRATSTRPDQPTLPHGPLSTESLTKDSGTKKDGKSKEKAKGKKKKKLGKKGCKSTEGGKTGKDLKGAKNGGIKKKTKKEGKGKKKKLKDKVKKDILSNKGEQVINLSEKSLQNLNMTNRQSIGIITKDRTKTRPHQTENFSRSEQLQNRNILPSNANPVLGYAPRAPPSFQQQQPPVNNSHFFNLPQQPYAPMAAQPHIAANVAPQVQFGQQLLPNQLSPLDYTGFNVVGNNAMFVTSGIATGYQQMNTVYYGGQTGSSINGSIPQTSLQSKEYAHLAWL